MGLAFGYIGYNYAQWENDLLVAVNSKRNEKGLPSITREQASPFSKIN
jgi:hypothetical protein